MTAPDASLIGDNVKWLAIVSQLFESRMNSLLEPHKLTLSQLAILQHIAGVSRHSGQRISDIADAVEANQPAVSKAVTKFRNMDLVALVADAHDQRAKRVSITQNGLDYLTAIEHSLAPDIELIFGAYTADDLTALLEALKKLGRWLDKNRL